MHNKSRKKLIIFLCIVLSLVLSIVFIKINFNVPSYGIKDGVMFINKKITRFFGDKNYYKLEEENKSLKEQLEVYKDYKALNDELNNEISKLKEVTSINKLLSDRKYVNGSVINRDLDYWQKKLVIDVGSSSDVKKDMAVISNGSLIGITDDVSMNSSSVILLSNHKFPLNISVKIKVGDNYVYGILNDYDEEEGLFEVIGVVDNIEIPADSLVVTSGLGNIFPSGILIGKVSLVTTDNFDLAKVIKVKPDTNFDDISYVTVVMRGEK